MKEEKQDQYYQSVEEYPRCSCSREKMQLPTLVSTITMKKSKKNTVFICNSKDWPRGKTFMEFQFLGS